MGHGAGRGQCDCGPPQRTHIPPLPPHHWHRVAPVRRQKRPAIRSPVVPGTPGTHGARGGTGSMRLRTASTYTHTPTATPPLAPGCPGGTTKEAGDTIPRRTGDTRYPWGTGRDGVNAIADRLNVHTYPHCHPTIGTGLPRWDDKRGRRYDRSGRRYDPPSCRGHPVRREETGPPPP